MQILFISFLLLTLAAVGVAQTKSVYTSTSEKACKQQKGGADEGGDYTGICPGVAGYKIELIEGDLRQTLNVITPAKKKLRLRFNEYYYSFSAVGEKIEWRLRKGVPYALIVRYNVADPEDSQKNTSYLMVAKISRSLACVTEIVPPGPKQNETARRLSDAAPTTACKVGGE
ncbi:MAG: hypothetical protein AB7J13_05305 [Pyrinomonadaceae bacterium]